MALSLAAGLIAALPLLLGWGVGIDLAKRLVPDAAAIVPSTSVALLILAAVLVSDARDRQERDGWVCVLAGVVVIAMGVVNVFLRTYTEANGLSSALMPALVGPDGTSVATAASMIGAGYCLASLNTRTAFRMRTYEIAATLGMALSLVFIVSHGFERALSGIHFFKYMSLPTSVAFLSIYTAFLTARREQTWLRHLMAREQGSTTARRLLPIVILAPLVFCFSALQLINDHQIEVSFAISVLAVLLVSVSLVALVRNASIANAEQLSQTVDELREINADKQVLLAEVYHRVKNNLQQMSAMIQLERSTITDPAERERLDKILYRIRSVGVVHQMLIGAKTPSRVEAGRFLGELVNGLATGYNLSERRISLNLVTDPVTLPLDMAVPTGLLVNELVTNAIKHAFPGAAGGYITVRYLELDDGLQLSVEDDGVGMSEEKLGAGLGTMIIKGLVNQLRGGMRINRRGGTVVTVFFPTAKENGGSL